ncbi:unnamed protein product, partial [Cyprideis torosa]
MQMQKLQEERAARAEGEAKGAATPGAPDSRVPPGAEGKVSNGASPFPPPGPQGGSKPTPNTGPGAAPEGGYAMEEAHGSTTPTSASPTPPGAGGKGKARSRKVSRLDEDYDNFLDSMMAQLKALPGIGILEPPTMKESTEGQLAGAPLITKIPGETV